MARCRVPYCEAPLCFEGLTKRRTSCPLWPWLLCWTVISKRSISSSNHYSEIETACFVVWRQVVGPSKTICIRAPDNTVSKLNNTTNWILTRHAMYVYCNMEACLCNHCLRGKAINVRYSECVFVALGIQPEIRMYRVLLLSVSCLSTLSHKPHDFLEKNDRTLNVCFDFLYNFCLKRFLFKEELSEMRSEICIGLHIKYPLFLSDFNENWICSTDFLKNAQI